MNIVLKRIEQNYNILTKNQKNIADYIIKNHEELPNLTARQLSKLTYTVPSSIISFSKSLGFEGFNELKFSYKNDKNDVNNVDKELIDVFIKVNKLTITSEFKETVRILKESNKVFIIASQMSQIPAKDFYYRMRKIEPAKMIFFEGFQDQLRMASIMDTNDVALIVSNSGEAREIKKIQPELINNNCKQVLVTNNSNSSLSKFSDVILSTEIHENNWILNQEVPTLSRYALIAILEKIYFEFLYDNFDENLERIKNISTYF